MLFDFSQINQLLLDYGYYLLFPLVVVEGPIVTIIAGFFVSIAQFNFYIVYPLVVIADLAGDVVYYWLGRGGHTGFIMRFGRYFGLTEEKVNSLKSHYKSHGGKTLLVGKLSHGIGGALLVAAGMGRMPFGKFIWYNFLGTVPKTLVLLAVGYFFGQAIARINTYLELLALIFLAIGLAVVLWYIFRGRASRVKQ